MFEWPCTNLGQVLAGVIVFDSTNMTSTIKKFSEGYQAMEKKGLPAALGIQRSIVVTPMGKCFIAGFMWSSPDLDEGRRYLEEISSLGTVIHNGVEVTTVPPWQQGGDSFCPKSAHGGLCTINIRDFTNEANEVIGEAAAKMPDDPYCLMSFHQLRGPSAQANNESVFGTRTPHYMVEFIGLSHDSDKAKQTWDWAVGSRDALRQTDSENILPSMYIAITPPSEATPEVSYGDNWSKLAGIKKRYDFNNMFKHALPRF